MNTPNPARHTRKESKAPDFVVLRSTPRFDAACYFADELTTDNAADIFIRKTRHGWQVCRNLEDAQA